MAGERARRDPALAMNKGWRGVVFSRSLAWSWAYFLLSWLTQSSLACDYKSAMPDFRRPDVANYLSSRLLVRTSSELQPTAAIASMRLAIYLNNASPTTSRTPLRHPLAPSQLIRAALRSARPLSNRASHPQCADQP